MTGVISGTGTLQKTGSGTLSLTGVNTYSGNTTVSGGVLDIGGAGSLGSGSYAGAISNTATLQFSSTAAQTLSGVISGTGTISKVSGVSNTLLLNNAGNTINGPLNIGAGTLEVGGAGVLASGNHTGAISNNGTLLFSSSANQTLGGVISGTGALNKTTGTGTLTLTGTNTYSGNTSVAAGTLTIGGTGVLGSSNYTGAISNNATLIHASSADQTWGGVMSGTGALQKTGSATLTLSGNNTYTGTTTVSGGRLNINGTQNLATGAVTVASGATLGGTGVVGGATSVASGGILSPGMSPGTLTFGNGLTLSSGSVTNFELAQVGVAGGSCNDLVAVTGSVVIDGTLNITKADGAAGCGSTFSKGNAYILFTYTVSAAINGSTTLVLPSGFIGRLVNDTVNKQVKLIVDTPAVFWDEQVNTPANANNGASNGGTGTWNATNSNWTGSDGSVNQPWANGTTPASAVAVFQGSAGTVTVSGTQTMAGLTFNTTGYTLTGGTLTGGATNNPMTVGTGLNATVATVLAGSNSFSKESAGLLTLNGVNTYTGATAINAGTLTLGGAGQLGAGSYAGAIGNAGSLVYASSAAQTLSGVISGTGSLSKTTSTTSTLTLSGANTYTGATSVTGGTLLVNGTQTAANGAVTVGTGATLGGTGGTVGGATTVQNGGVLSPGAGTGAVGTLSFANGLTLSATSTTQFDLAQAGTAGGTCNDLTAVTGNLTLAGTLTVAATSGCGSTFGGGVYTLFTYTGTLTGSFATVNLPAGFVGRIDTTSQANKVLLVISDKSQLTFWDVTPANNNAVEGGTGTWNTTTKNWTDSVGANNDVWPAGSSVATFQGTAGTVTVSGTQSMGGLTFNTTGYTVTGGTGLTGTAASNPITVGTGVSATVASPLLGTNAFTKEGAGTLTLSGVSTYTGTTTVNGGTLQVTGSTAAGAVSVASGATLAGTGTVGGATTVQAGGILSPGVAAAGKLNLSQGLTLNAASISNYQLAQTGMSGGSCNDLVAVTGSVTLGGALNVTNANGIGGCASTFGAGIYTLFTYTGSVSGSFSSISVPAGFVAKVDTSVANQVRLIVQNASSMTYWDESTTTTANGNNNAVNGGTGTWDSTSSNWTDNTGSVNGLWAAGSSQAIFQGTAGSVTVSGTQSIGGLIFGTTGYTITGGTLTGAATNNPINVGPGLSATVATVLAGSNSFSKVSLGLLTLTGINTYTGATAVDFGTLALGTGGSINTSSGIRVAFGATLSFSSTSASSVTPVISGAGVVSQTGSGTTTLTAVNTFTGNITIAAGTLDIGGSGSLGAGTYFGSISNAGTLQYSSSAAQTLSGVISGAGGVSKTGAGTLTLSGANSYTGATSVTGGTLLVNGNQSTATGAVTVGTGATLGGTGTVGGAATLQSGATLSPGVSGPSTLSFKNGLTVMSGATQNIELAQAGVAAGACNDLVAVTGSLVLDGTFNISATSGCGSTFGKGTYTLMTYTGTAAVTGTVNAVLPVGMNGRIVNDAINKKILLVVDSPAVYWDEATNTLTNQNNGVINGGTGTWDGSNRNWTAEDGLVNDVWAAGSTPATSVAIFQGAAGTVTVSGSQTIAGLTFNTNGYVLSGGALTGGATNNPITVGTGLSATVSSALTGSNGFSKEGSGTLTLTGVSTYSGATAVNGGTLVLGTGGLVTSSSGITLASGTTLKTASSSANSVSVLISGAGALEQTGSGTTTLAAVNTYAGGTTVTGGTLKAGVNNALPTSRAVTVSSGAILDVSGTIQSVSTLSSSGTLALGTNGQITLTSGASSIGAVTGSGKIIVATGATLTLTQALVNSGVAIELAGGTVQLGAGLTHTLGALTVTASGSVLDFAAAGNAKATFSSADVSSGAALSVTNWTNGADLLAATAVVGSPARLTMNVAPLNRITFTGFPASNTNWLVSQDEITPIPPNPRVRVAVVSNNGTGSFFYSLNGLNSSAQTLTTTTSGVAVSSASLTGSTGAAATLSQVAVPTGWPATPVSASCVDNLGSINSNGTGTFGSLAGATLTVPAVNMVAGADIVCTFTNTLTSSLAGKVFNDGGAPSAGSNTGTPNNGVQDGAEAGLAGLTVSLSNCAATTYASTSTDASGAYSLSIPAAQAGQTVCVAVSLPSGQLATGANVGGTPTPDASATAVGGVAYTYSRSAQRQSFTAPATGTLALNFGQVPVSTLVSNSNQVAAPGSTATHSHRFTAGTGGALSVSTLAATASPSSVTGWNEIVYLDPGCTGTYQANATKLSPPTAPVTVVQGQVLCFVVREFVPSPALNGSINSVPVQAALSLTNASPALSVSYTVTDTTTVSTAAVLLRKQVRNVTTGGANAPWNTGNNAKSGDVLEYQISFTNASATPVTEVVIQDGTTNWTTWTSATVGTLPSGLSCALNTPVNPAPAAAQACTPAVTGSGKGNLTWTFSGSLQPGASGTVIFKVTVD